MNMRRLKMGLNTVLGLKKQGFFIPYRYAGSPSPLANRTHYPAILAHMQKSIETQTRFLEEMSAYAEEFSSVGKTPPPEPRWEQDWFPRLDGAAAYKMVRDIAPKNIIEVGSGHSTRFMARAIKDGGLQTNFTAIDPAPRADISKLDVTILNKTVQEVDPTTFDLLQPNDILFIDSSHIAMPGTDVDMLILDILPRLPAGVYVHIHDIFLPFSYPKSWAWRGYNEQQMVAPLLTSGGYELLFSSQFVFNEMKDVLGKSKLAKLPLLPGAMETSLWLRKST
ncbi:MAG: class I SAM-dependent methyltransferase [Sneathiella sp.]